MSFFDQVISSFFIGLISTFVCLRLIMRRRLSWLHLVRYVASRADGNPLQLQNGPWRMDLSVGSKDAGLFTRAIAARHSTFALSAPETVYFATTRDSAGQPLNASSTYSIEGCDLESRWWSITVYKQRHLISNPLNRYSFTKTTLSRRPDGSWRILLSPREQSENWLPTGDPDGPLSLILRFYGPGLDLLSHPETVQLPQILEVR